MLVNTYESSDRIYRIIGILFAFPEERQKALSLFEGKGRLQARHKGQQKNMRTSGAKTDR
jgi:hypothetical protein